MENLWRTRHAFFAANAAVRAEAEELQDRTRRRDLLVDDQVIFDFYEARIPADVVSGTHFDTWWKQARDSDPDLLTLTLDDLVVADRPSDAEAFPDEVVVGSHRLPLRYRFEPGHPRDGVSVIVPLALRHPTGPGAVQLAGAGTAERAGNGAHPVAAEGRAPLVRAGGGVRRTSPGLARRAAVG